MAEATGKIDLSAREHPLYTDYKDKWDFYLQSVKGGDDYTKDEDNLFTHRLESSSDDYEDRKSRAYFLNYCSAIPQIYADYIFKEKVTRPADDTLTEFREDVDGRGTSIVAFMRKISILSSIFGHIHIVIDTPQIEKDAEGKTVTLTKRDQKEKKLRPILSIVYPQALKDWSVDKTGTLNWVLIEIQSYDDANPLLERVAKTTYKIISRDKWEIYDEDSNLIDSGVNELGEVYMVTCYNKDIDLDLIGESQLSDIAYVNRAIFNWCSNIDEMIERQTFSQLICPDDGTLSEQNEENNPLKRIGTSHIFTFPSDTGHPPSFISPDTSQVDIIWKMIKEHVKEIWRLAGLRSWDEGISVSQRSGVSMQFSFLDVNSALAAKASSLEVVENSLNGLYYKWMGKETDTPPAVHYPTSFDVLTLTEAIETTFKIVQANISETLNKHLLKSLVSKALPVISEDIKGQIEAEIDAGDGTIESVELLKQQLTTSSDQIENKEEEVEVNEEVVEKPNNSKKQKNKKK